MDNLTAEARKYVLRLDFDLRLMLAFHGAKVTIDTGLSACRELDGAVGLTPAIGLGQDTEAVGKECFVRNTIIGRCFRSVERGLRRRVTKPMKGRFRREVARCYRTALGVAGDVCFIGITGSCGKTTTTELVAAILSRRGRTGKGSHRNTMRCFPRSILALTPRHRFSVHEVAGHEVGVMEPAVRLIKPRIGVVTYVAQDHYGAFRTLEATAAEKGKLVEGLPVDGVAVLNADDPLVAAMAERTKARVMTYGLSSEATVRGRNVACSWPSAMSLDISYEGHDVHLQTQLLGTHWAHVVLAAVSTALAAGVSLDQAVEAVEAFEPVPHRMSPHTTPDGITFVSDVWKAPFWTAAASLDFLRTARARRKLAVIGTLSDTPKSFRHRHRAAIEEGIDTVHRMFFVGPHAQSALQVCPSEVRDRVLCFDSVYQLDRHLHEYLEPGDLVLLKGSAKSDHLSRLILSWTDDIACWREGCRRIRFCATCEHQHEYSPPPEPKVVKGARPRRAKADVEE